MAEPGVGADDASDMVLPLSRKLELRYWADSNPFHSINFSQLGSLDFGSPNVEILIAPPSPAKPSVMPRLRAAEIDAITKADEVFVIGWSLPETDHDQQELIKDAVGRRSKDIRRLTVVNYKASAKYFEDVKGVFKPRDTREFNDGLPSFLNTDRVRILPGVLKFGSPHWIRTARSDGSHGPVAPTRPNS
jgi:hypothetical protein